MAKDRIYLTTPPAEVKWANLIRPDNRFSPPGDPGMYSVLVLLDPERADHAALLKELEGVWDAEYKSTCRAENKTRLPVHDKPWKADTDEDGAPTGLVSIRPKNKEWYTDRNGVKVEVEIDQYDAAKKRIKVEVGNGSICRVNFEAFGFYYGGKFGVSLRLRAVQVLDLIEYGRDYGFDEEDGYRGKEYVPEEDGDEDEAQEEQVEETQFAADDDLPF